MELVEECEQALRAARLGVDRTRVRGTAEWREAIANADGSAQDVAHRFEVNKKTVLSFRGLYRTRDYAA